MAPSGCTLNSVKIAEEVVMAGTALVEDIDAKYQALEVINQSGPVFPGLVTSVELQLMEEQTTMLREANQLMLVHLQLAKEGCLNHSETLDAMNQGRQRIRTLQLPKLTLLPSKAQGQASLSASAFRFDDICLHPNWELSPEKPWVWAKIMNHQFAILIYSYHKVPEHKQRWRIRVRGEMIFCRDEDRKSGYWVALKLNWINHGYSIIDVSEVDWHITLGHFICNDDELVSITRKTNQKWEKWRVFDLVINERTPMNAAECIMWEFNTSPHILHETDHHRLVQTEQIINARCASYKHRRSLTKNPRLHLSQWSKSFTEHHRARSHPKECPEVRL